jgi:hypothetical protein
MLFNQNVFTRDEVETILQAAKDSLMAGKSVVQWTSLGSSAQLQWDISPMTVIKEATLYLQTVDPDTYGVPVKTGRITHTSY